MGRVHHRRQSIEDRKGKVGRVLMVLVRLGKCPLVEEVERKIEEEPKANHLRSGGSWLGGERSESGAAFQVCGPRWRQWHGDSGIDRHFSTTLAHNCAEQLGGSDAKIVSAVAACCEHRGRRVRGRHGGRRCTPVLPKLASECRSELDWTFFQCTNSCGQGSPRAQPTNLPCDGAIVSASMRRSFHLLRVPRTLFGLSL